MQEGPRWYPTQSLDVEDHEGFYTGTELADFPLPSQLKGGVVNAINAIAATDAPVCFPSPSGLVRLLNFPRSRYALLQALVGIILSYELIYGGGGIVTRAVSDGLAAGFILMILAMLILPRGVVESSWLPGALITMNTVAVTGTIYLSGNARREMYLSYFLLILIAASVRTSSQMLGFSIVVCAGYGTAVYGGVLETGLLSVGQLLGIPILLVMAVFYRVTLESLTSERKLTTSLIKDVDELKEKEKALLATHGQLESRVTGLRQDLTKANQVIEVSATERQGLERRLRDAQKMEAFGRIAGGTAKEFSHLLTVVGSQTGLVLSKLKPGDPLYQPVEDIFRAGERAAALTTQLVSLHVTGECPCDPVALHPVLSELHGLLVDLLPNGIDLRWDLDSSPGWVYADREHVERMLFHLVINARDAMPNGGRLVIETKPITQQPLASASSKADRSVSMVRLSVSDTGRGMTRETQARMFEPFFSTKSSRVGLGLPTVYGIAKQLGGYLDVASKPGQGTTIHVFIPQAAQSAHVRHGEADRAVMAKGNETVLLVEDDEVLRKLAASALARHKYQVLEATSPVEALLLAHQHTGSIHLSVSQLVMPEVNGCELAQRLVSQHPGMKALFVSGYSNDAILHHRLPSQFVLQRPYRQGVLLQKIREVLDAA